MSKYKKSSMNPRWEKQANEMLHGQIDGTNRQIDKAYIEMTVF
jgi:hypothetical protein